MTERSTIEAAAIHEPGGPGVFGVESRPIPTPVAGEVPIRVEAFGTDRRELPTRQGRPPGVLFPAPHAVGRSPGSQSRSGSIGRRELGRVAILRGEH